MGERTSAGGHPLVWHDTIDSTNEEARRLRSGGETGPLWIAAGAQSAGRGRLGRGWVSDPGNLYATLLITLPVTLPVAAQASLVAALAMAEAVRTLAPQAPVRLKWPNDVLIGDEKVSGILVETLGQGPDGVTLAIGCGLNLVHAPEGQRRPATALARHGAAVEPLAALQVLGDAMNRGFADWANGKNFDGVRRRWMEAAGGQGETIEVDVAGRRTVGTFGGLDADGALRLTLADGTVHVVRAGDVVPGRSSGVAH